MPPEVTGRAVERVDGTATIAVTVDDAARLMGWRSDHMRRLIGQGKVDVCQDGPHTYVLVDSLWALVPEEMRRG